MVTDFTSCNSRACKDFVEFLKGGGEADNQLLYDNEYKDFMKTLSFSDLWYSNFMNRETRVLLTYSWKMRFFNDYAQQLEMESIGKQPNKDSIFQKTGQIVYLVVLVQPHSIPISVTTSRNIICMCRYIHD